ncbi:siroheme synthase CysG [Taklimakanibacter deserti]|uniref:siroheme synthase CysG n=1 Tax=Taklimakanibacter deserti TaxID=2267839 RepID=UPI000E651FD8
MRYFPLFLDLDNRKVVIVGGGEEALRKVRLLLKTKARINVVAPALHEELAAYRNDGRIVWLAKSFAAPLLDDAALVYSADDDLHHDVAVAAGDRGIPVNAVDDAALSTFITPSIVDRDPVVVAIGTEGTSPVLGMGLRSRIEALLPQALGSLAEAASHLRQSVAERVPQGNRRRSFWQRYFFGSIRDSFLAGDARSYTRELEAALIDVTSPSVGRVSLVGAGPGDPELLTLKAQRKLQEADVIVHDRLIGPGILELARRDAIRIPVGKTPFAASPKQSEINAILIREAKAGRHVVRLKGGDPYVFGRGGEEQAALADQGIPVDVVPGITAALGCAASVGLPLTQRGQNRSITLLTGASEDGLAQHDWAALAKPGQAFAIYMGVNAAGDISAELLDAGIDHRTPVTVVENGTLANERVMMCSIGSLWETLALNGVEGPAIIYVGLKPATTSADILTFPAREATGHQVLRAAS